MSFQGYQREVDSLVGHEIRGTDDSAQVVLLTHIQVAQIVSNAVSQALTRQMQQFQTPIKFDVPTFEGDSTASWLTWSQRVLYQARASGFENELTSAEGDGLSVGADVFDSSSVDPVRLRNVHVAWMTLINSCRGMALEIVQHSNAATHRTTRGEISNYTIEQKELGKYFVCPMKSTEKRWNQVVTHLSSLWKLTGWQQTSTVWVTHP